MFQIPDMSSRVFIPELMDDTGCGEDELHRTLIQFKGINRLFSRSGTLVKQYLIPHMMLQGKREIVVADIGAGGCDFAMWFTSLCQAKKIRVRVLCIDHDPRVVRFARRVCRGHENITVREESAFSIDAIDEPVDYIFSNHFLHHISSGDIPGLLSKIYSTASCGFLINDLVRSRGAYIGFTLFCRAFLQSAMTRNDGRLSIRKGFTENEMVCLATEALLPEPVTIGTMFPGRVFCCCLKPGSHGGNQNKSMTCDRN
jgi:hypothetical protein